MGYERPVIYDYCVVGGGIVGMATAMTLLERHPGAAVLLLEKETEAGRHQTVHNSGVIHAGIYYRPGSLKAELCRRGARATKDFCREHGIPFEAPGKLLVATDESEVARMEALHERARHNDIDVERISRTRLREMEPAVSGRGALLVKETGIVDYGRVCAAMSRVVRSGGGHIEFGAEVTGIRETAERVTVRSGVRSFDARKVIVCGGLQADRLARMAGVDTDFRIVPFRGEYYRLPADRAGIVDHLIYPIPDPSLPFLGVHLTPMIDGSVTVGPNAVLGLSREGYRKRAVRAADVLDYLSFPGFWKVARDNVRTGAVEMRNSLWKRGYLRECRRYAPGLELRDLLPEQAGIRAQAVLRDGTLVHDFLFRETARTVHVCNAPSPAATSAMPIAEMIAAKCDGDGR
ncbi:L-2-hydroxyglutarate oxidase [Saccharopolyspora lacisalsi]|uniref:L-2-hydroxyglutarate oxidase n=1 Tax=Halosaccharopolyspora lacisalsi TaxID=1000566 RepID=A0A839DU81_9PSEU|nr:L-2-hydroxyglutarate oxidase [Halosaccharopolyspora lacisalsi]MBA8824480.1 L-2-hydroxyglutarate oxidase [Halosaccharopolyspora lacisalsi]